MPNTENVAPLETQLTAFYQHQKLTALVLQIYIYNISHFRDTDHLKGQEIGNS